MSDAQPFLFKVRVRYTEVPGPAAGYQPTPGQYDWTPGAGPGDTGGQVFVVHAAEKQAHETASRPSVLRLAGALTDAVWAKEEYFNPKDLPERDLDPHTVAFGNALFFTGAAASAARIAVRTGNPPALDPGATPDPLKGSRAADRFGLWRITSLHRPGFSPYLDFTTDFVLGWPDLSVGPRRDFCPVVNLATDLVLVTPGLAYMRAFPETQSSGRDFTHIDISREDYRNLSLISADFTGSNLAVTIFYKSDLTKAVFDSTTLSGANFRGAMLTAARFKNCCLQGAWVIEAVLASTLFSHCDFTGAEFGGTVALGATFDHCTFKDANLGGAGLIGTIFDNCQFPNADFSGADLSGAVFRDCDLRGATWSEPPVWAAFPDPRTDFTRSKIDASFLGSKWSNLILTGIEWSALPPKIEALDASHAVLPGMQLTGMDLRKADFTSADMSGAGLSGANLAEAKFTRADLRGADLSGCQLMLADFTGARLQSGDGHDSATLSGATMMDACFDGADLSDTLFVGSYFWGENASVVGATMVSTDFSNAYLAGVRFADVAQKAFTGAKFSGACLVNASFADTNCGSVDGARPSFAGACLLGTDFTGAILGNADLKNAAIAVENGSITPTICRGWPLEPRAGHPIEYQPTKGIETATTTHSICPSGVGGPCEGSKLQRTAGVPATWP